VRKAISMRGFFRWTTAGSAVVALLAAAPRADAQAWLPDAGPGRYRNPIVFADYSDPDVIRVGADFYMTASSFGHVPGLPILHSRDLVHWRLVGHALPRLYGAAFDSAQHGNGVWAPSIRHHGGWFWIFWGDPDRGIYRVRARDPRGPWEAPVLVRAAKGWIDPAPLWDDDGNAYLVHAFARSRSGIKHVLHVNRMDAGGTRLLDDGRLVFGDSVNQPTMEGPKLYKRNGFYYIFAPAGGVPTGWQTVLRSRNVYGPYEPRIVMAQGGTPVNGPHQGGWVELENGEGWFIHFQDRGAYGRIVHLQPLAWRDDWPVIGSDPDRDGRGEPVAEWAMPRVGRRGPSTVPQETDEFGARAMGPQWQWQANPRDAWFSLASRPGWLRLRSRPSADSTGSLWPAPNLLMQKLPAPAFTATTRMVFAPTAPGERAGLVVFGLDYATLALERTATGIDLVQARAANAHEGGRETSVRVPVPAGPLYLRVTVTDNAVCRFSYSVDGSGWRDVGQPFTAREGRWVGAKVGLFAAAPVGAGTVGHADFDFFRILPER
ncbi:MAG: glycoside hydrolase 43 family protein, partial [Longimicrobiaceae bacterium]